MTNLMHNYFPVYLFQFFTCFKQPRAHHQENQLYQCNLWYMSLCFDVCRSERNFPTCTRNGHRHRVTYTTEEEGEANGTQNIHTETRLNLSITREENMSAFYCEKWKCKYPTYKTTQGSVRCKLSATTQRKIVTECYIRLRWIGPLSYTPEQTTRNEVVHWEVLATKRRVDIEQSHAHSVGLSSIRWSSSQES
jgi:hypothetical protein